MSEQEKIRNTIQIYFECMYESDPDKAHQAFHPEAKVVGYTKDGLQQMTVTDFANFVASKRPSHKEKGDPILLEIVSLDVAGNTAVARVRDAYIGLKFLDTLSFIKEDDNWLIYNKLFHVEAASVETS